MCTLAQAKDEEVAKTFQVDVWDGSFKNQSDWLIKLRARESEGVDDRGINLETTIL